MDIEFKWLLSKMCSRNIFNQTPQQTNAADSRMHAAAMDGER